MRALVLVVVLAIADGRVTVVVAIFDVRMRYCGRFRRVVQPKTRCAFLVFHGDSRCDSRATSGGDRAGPLKPAGILMLPSVRVRKNGLGRWYSDRQNHRPDGQDVGALENHNLIELAGPTPVG